MAMYGQLADEMEATNRGVVALYAELESKSEQLREASEAKSRFLANVSHELRTPVNSILGITALLADDPTGVLSEDQRYEVGLVSSSALDLLNLVNDLLDLAKAESGRLDPLVERVSASALCRDVRAALAPLAAEGVTLGFEDDSDGIDEVETDAALLSRVVRNLVTNALKFTEVGSVRICLRPSPSRQHIEIAVADTGIGISPAHQEAIFEEFFQVRGRLQVKAKGTGLGLPYARRVVEALGGSLALASTEGEGSTFTVQLPVHWHLTSAVEEGPASEVEARVGTVLVVDDDEAFRHVLRGMLQGSADRVVEAADGLEAMDFVRNRSTPDVVFLDLRMPGADGYEVLSFLEGAGLGDIAVFVTTSMELPLPEMPTLAGARAVVSKASITPRVIRSLLAGIVRGAGRVGG
jgi:CheY-like chemotaxis protein